MSHIQVVAGRWRLEEGDSGWSSAYDLNNDGVITIEDVMRVAAAWGLECGGLPPDPEEVAPELDESVVTLLHNAVAFLYSGDNPIQTGVAPGTIQPLRVAVLRGRVLDRDDQPLAGVRITVLDHPEFGQTRSREDGMFDLAVNGGGHLTIEYRKEGYLPAQRQVHAPWQDYSWLPDVVLISVDPQVTTIDLTSAAAIQVAQGSVISDTDGVRQATVLFPQGVQAALVLPGGITQTLTTLNVRATEYTVGDNGTRAMPAELPATSGYTYAAEFSVDEAMAAGAVDVQFDRPVYTYVENFLDFPVGGAVPVGYYDRARGLWVPSQDGRIIQIIGVVDGLAELDVDGSGQPAGAEELAALGFTDAERRQLATLYAAGTSLWRVPMTHFSAWDCNWPFGPPPGGGPPPNPDPGGGGGGGGGGPGGDDGPGGGDGPDDECPQDGSIIQCHRQVLGEAVPVAGTGYRLHYSSDRVPGRAETRTLQIRLSGPTLTTPPPKQIELEINIAGRLFRQSFAPAPNLMTTFEWDGRDAYGRELVGWQPATVRVGNTYDGVYHQPGVSPSFAAPSGVPITGSRTREEVTIWSVWHTRLAKMVHGPHGFAGWSLNVHHVYDPAGQVVYLGNGDRRTSQSIVTVNTVQGVHGGIFEPDDVAAGPDGSVYVANSGNHRILRIGTDGSITVVAGGGSPPPGSNGDGGPATAARLSTPSKIALGPDGSLFIVEHWSQRRVRRVGPDGIINTFAGDGTNCAVRTDPCGDGGPATAAQFGQVAGITVGRDGSVYVSDSWTLRVRRIGPDGIITTVAGAGVEGVGGENGPATAAQFRWLGALAVGPDGSLYIGDSSSGRVLRVAPDGILTRVAGGPPCCVYVNGGSALEVHVSPYALALGSNGGLYILSRERIHLVTDGLIRTIAGGGDLSLEGMPATATWLRGVNSFTLAPNGSIYFAEFSNARVRRITSLLPGFSFAELIIPAADGSELYLFNSAGRHLQTLHALTGAVLLEFGYDSAGRLISISDADGNTTIIERDSSGNPIAIVAPFGQRTTLVVDANDYLSQITNPAGETVLLTTSADGLLASLIDPRGGLHRFEYDDSGRLVRDEDPAGAVTTLARVETASAYTVTVTTAGQVTTYSSERLPGGARRLVTTFPGGAQTVVEQATDGTSTVNYADGTRVTSALAPDPRWKMQAPFVKSQTVTTPDGRVQSTTRTRTATLADPNNVMSLTSLTEAVTIGGRTTTSVYNAQTRRFTTTSPAGRTSTVTLDARGRLMEAQVTGLEPVIFTYDSYGRVATVTMGAGATARTTTLTYGSSGPAAAYLLSVTDPLGRSTSFVYDAAGRTTQQTLYGGQIVGYGYDAVGNLTSLTPPGRATHTFAYSVGDELASYTPPPPASGVNGAPTTYQYDSLGRLTGITQPDGQGIEIAYDGFGRPYRLTQPQGLFEVTHDDTTGDVKTITTSAGVVLNFEYDGVLPKSESWSGPIAGNVSRTFDNTLRTATRSVNGDAIDLEYDPDSLLTRAGALALSRHPQHGMVIGTTLSMVTDEWEYTGFGGLDHYIARAGGTPFYSALYARDQIGRIVEQSETIGGATDVSAYAYDTSGRLTEVMKNGATTHSYTYDANGNRLSAGPPGSPVAATYDGQDRLIQAGNATYAYMVNGELRSKSVAGQTTTYSYDALGILTNVTLPGGEQIEYVIDGLGRRVGKGVNGALAQGWLYDEWARVVAELDGTGALVSRFVYGSRPNVPDYLVRGSATYRIISNHLGSPRLVVNAADGTIVQQIDYDALGNVVGETLAPGFAPIPFGFAGGLYDRDTGLVRLGVRDYDAETGRWTSRDPILFAGQATNLYTYASNDPINRRDADGMEDEPATGGVCIFPPAPLPGLDGKPIFLDPGPSKPEPPVKPLPSFSDMQKERQQSKGSKSGGGGLSLGPFTFKPKPKTPSVSDIRNKDPQDWFKGFDLNIEAPIYPDFTMPPKPEKPGGPDPKSPDTRPPGPQCKPKLDQPDPLGCEA